MATFTIDSENNIAAHAGSPANADNLGVFASGPQCARFISTAAQKHGIQIESTKNEACDWSY